LPPVGRRVRLALEAGAVVNDVDRSLAPFGLEAPRPEAERAGAGLRARAHDEPQRPVRGALEAAEPLDLGPVLDLAPQRIPHEMLEVGPMPRSVADRTGVLDVEQDLRQVELALRLVPAARVGRFERRLEKIAERAAAAGLRKGCQVPRDRLGNEAQQV